MRHLGGYYDFADLVSSLARSRCSLRARNSNRPLLRLTTRSFANGASSVSISPLPVLNFASRVDREEEKRGSRDASETHGDRSDFPSIYTLVPLLRHRKRFASKSSEHQARRAPRDLDLFACTRASTIFSVVPFSCFFFSFFYFDKLVLFRDRRTSDVRRFVKRTPEIAPPYCS